MHVRDYFLEKIDFDKVNPKVIKYIEEFISDNIEGLTSKSFVQSVIFGGDRKHDLLNIYNFDERDFKSFKRGNKYLTKSEENKDPLNSLLLFSYFAHDDKEEAKRFLIFLMIKFYSSKYKKYFKYGVVEERMEYTIQNLSQRYDIKKHGTLLKVFRKKLETMLNKYGKEFKRMNDGDVYDNGILTHFSTRVNLMVRPLANNEYYENEKVMWKDEEIRDRDNQRLTSNVSVEFDTIKNNITTKAIKFGMDDKTLNQINGGKFRKDFQNMYDNDAKKIAYLYTLMIDDYITNTSSLSIEKAKRYGVVEHFKKSRKKNPEIKKTMEELANEYCTSNKSEFVRTLNRYMVVSIHKEIQSTL